MLFCFLTACLASQNCKQVCHVDSANYEDNSPRNTTSANQGAITFYCCLIYPARFFLEGKVVDIQHAELTNMETSQTEMKTLCLHIFERLENLCSECKDEMNSSKVLMFDRGIGCI